MNKTTQESNALGVDFRTLPPVEPGSTLPAAWWLAWGYLRSGGSERFLSLVTMISILGVLVGVALLDAVLAVMTGFEVDLRDKILGANAHVVVMRYGGDVDLEPELWSKLDAVPGVQHASPFIYSEVMLRSRSSASGVVLKGIDPERTGQVTAVREQLSLGVDGPLETDEQRLALFTTLGEDLADRAGQEPLPRIVLGDELMATLQVLPGDVVQVIDPIGKGGGLLGIPTPSFKSFRVAAAFHSGMFEYDTKWVYVTIPAAQAFFNRSEGVTGIEVRVDDIDNVQQIARSIEERLGYPFYARHWKNLNQALFEALAMEKVVMSLILGMVVVVAGLLIVSNLYTMVLTHRGQIAILKAMGAGRAMIMRIYTLVGVFIGLLGTVFGTLLGLALCWFLDRYKYPLETDVYFVSSLPVVVQPLDITIVAVAAFLVCFGSTLYPAFRAAGLDPIEGLRDE